MSSLEYARIDGYLLKGSISGLDGSSPNKESWSIQFKVQVTNQVVEAGEVGVVCAQSWWVHLSESANDFLKFIIEFGLNQD